MGAAFSYCDAMLQHTALYRPHTNRLPRIPVAQQPELMGAPLCKVSVLTSHNSYLQTIQILSTSSADAIMHTVRNGARCIELDMFRDPDVPSNVFIAHGQPKEPCDIIVTTKLPLTDALAVIAREAFSDTDDPLFLCIELNIHSDVVASDTIAAALEFHFGDRLFKGTCSPNTPLRDVVGKVVIMTGGGAAGTRLPGLINASWGSEFQNACVTTPLTELSPGISVVRIYPVGDTIEGLISRNYDALPFLKAGITFVTMNVCVNDAQMDAYNEYFGNSSFRLAYQKK